MKQTASVIFRSVILILAGVTIGLLLNNQGFVARQVAGNHKIDSALLFIKQHYVDSVNTDTIETNAINKILQQLDPHSVYLASQQAQSVNERLEGHFSGLGIEYILLRDTMFITQVYPGSPAFKAGIINGDRVVSVNNKPVSGTHITTNSVNKLLRGVFGSRLDIAVKPLSGNQSHTFTVIRGAVPLSSLDAAYPLLDSTGYIKLSKFATTTDSDFRTAFRKLQKTGVNRLIVDLRGNRGGYLNAATALADEFLPKDKLIVYTKGAHEAREDYFSTNSGLFQKGKLAVLIDEYSASASEILSGALQDLDRAIIVGRRSFGKGLVQQQFLFGDGSAINLTVARYYTPLGRSIQKSYKNGTEEYRKEIGRRSQQGELSSAASNLRDSNIRKTAFFTASGKKVYGGGGIMPDIFVPEDSSANTKLLAELNANQLYTAYTIDKLVPALNNYSNLNDFLNHFSVTDAQLDSFIIYASGTLKEMDSKEIRVSKEYIKRYIKAFAARFKWGDNAYFQTLLNNDEGIHKAFHALE